MASRFLVGTIATAALLLTSASTSAQTGIDAQENVFGATNINATFGHGRLTAGVSQDGDITVLSWPSPSFSDQLGYRTSNALDARMQPRFGALEGAGIVLGLRYELADASTGVTWLRDRDAWTISQDYGPQDGGNPHTTFVNDTLGLTVLLVDAIDPEQDVLVRQLTVTREASSTVTSAALLTYANLSPVPTTSRVPELPIVDWIKDGENDFAAIWDASRNVVVHFHPDDERIFNSILGLGGAPDVDWGPIGAALQATTITEADVASLVAQLEGSYGAGAWLTLGTVPPPEQHQIGFDASPLCDQLDELLANLAALPQVFEGFNPPIEPGTAEALLCKTPLPAVQAEQGWIYDAADAWQDAQDGELSGASIAAGEAAESLRTPLSFDASGVATAAVVLAAGDGFGSSGDAFDAASDPAAVLSRADEATDTFVAGLTIPGAPGERTYEVARRSLLNLRVGTDVTSGAVVASIARQPPYGLDWPRDGAFFNVMLDASGQSALVDQRVDLYVSWQRQVPVSSTPLISPPPPVDPTTGENTTYPADAWEMNYFADGVTGGTFRFEIDTTAFAVWTIVAHAGWVSDPAGYLVERWDAIKRGSDLLARWKDEDTGLHAPAQEDDAAAFTQTLHGAITVFGALDIAARAARLIGEDTSAETWEARALELEAAMRENFYDQEQGVYFMTESDRLPIQASGLTPVGPTAWLVWPFPLFPFDDPQMGAQLARDYEIIEPALTLEGKGGLYYMKNTISIALAGQDVLGDIIPTLSSTLAAQATPDTDHFGEVMVVVDEGGMPIPNQRVSTPHLWEGTLYYLTALAVESPSALLAYDEVLPPSRVQQATMGDVPPDDGGCGCRLAGKQAEPHAVWLVALALGLLWTRRRMAGCARRWS